jgi:monothiol glutaredoxin
MNVQDNIKKLIADNEVILFMKGNKQIPQCGFSAQAVFSLMENNVDFTTVNVLEKPEIRQELPLISNWPTFPQLFVKGELIGGSDIIIEEFKSGNIQKMLNKEIK